MNATIPPRVQDKLNARDDERRTRRLDRLVATWPAIDRELWLTSCAPGDPFDDPGYGSTLRLASRHKIARGYTYWLDFLRASGRMDETTAPEARISHARSAAWFRALKGRGNAPFTIVGRFAELSMAIKVMAPHADRSCILQPYGASVRCRLTLTKREIDVPDVRILYAEGFRLMDSADLSRVDADLGEALKFRDGLLFATLASRGRRLGTIVQAMTSSLMSITARARPGWLRFTSGAVLPIAWRNRCGRIGLPSRARDRVNTIFVIPPSPSGFPRRPIQNAPLSGPRTRRGRIFFR